MKQYHVEIEYTEIVEITVEANSKDEAEEKALEDYECNLIEDGYVRTLVTAEEIN